MRWLVLVVGLAGTLATAAAPPAPPRTVASIAPLHSIVAGVTRGVTEPVLLVPARRSPHAFALAPSDARALAGADLVVAAGGATDRFLARPLAALAADAVVLRLLELDGVHLLPARGGGAWPDTHETEVDRGTAAGATVDPHAWLDPRNAIALTRAVAERLAAIDPARASHYRERSATRVERLRALDAALGERLRAVGGRPYLVFHDAYQYLERRYGIAAAGAVVVDPGRPAGARRLAGLRRRVREQGIRCLFVEPQLEPGVARSIAADTGVRLAELDPLGAGLEPGPELYFELMRRLAEQLESCLGGNG